MRTTQLVELVTAVLATVLNLILIPIIITKSSIKMGHYKYFLLAYTVTATVTNVPDGQEFQTWYLPKNGFLFVCTAEFFPRWLEELHMMLFNICYVNTIIILVGSFMYRVSVMENSTPWMVKRNFAPLTVAVLIIPQIVAPCGLLYMSPSKDVEEAYREEIMTSLGIDITSAYYIGGQLTLPVIVMLGIVGVVFSIGIFICILCWLRIGSKLKELRTLTNSSYKHHHNFYILLTLQTCLPLIFYAMPLTIMIAMGLIQVSSNDLSGVSGMCLSFAQALDPHWSEIMNILLYLRFKEFSMKCGQAVAFVYYKQLNFLPMRITQWVEFGAAVLATALNLILIPIILTKSSVKMGHYKYFLLAYTTTAAIYSYAVSTLLLTWYLPENGFLFICTVDIFPRWLAWIHSMAFNICYLNTIIILVGSFMYRLSVLQNSFSWMLQRRFAPYVMVALIIPHASAMYCSTYIQPSEKTEAAFREEVMLALGVDLSTTYYVGGPFFVKDQLQLPIFLLLGTIGAILATGILICIVCWLRIGAKLRELRSLTNSSYKYQKNFYILLTLQACLPLIFYAIPFPIVTVMGFTQISYNPLSDISGMCLTFAQVLDPLLAIYFISDYRRFLLRKKAALWHYLGITSHSVHVVNTDNSGSIWNSRA